MTSAFYTYPDGTTYEGEWKDDKRHGHGVWTRPDGTVYVGEWKNDKPHGQGTIAWPSGKKFNGEWRNGKRHGSGIEISPDGTKRFGEWEDGKLIAERRTGTAQSMQYLDSKQPNHDYKDEYDKTNRHQVDLEQDKTQTKPPSSREKHLFISPEEKRHQHKNAPPLAVVLPVLIIIVLLVVGAIIFIFPGGKETYSASGQVVNYKGEGISGVTIDIGEELGTTNTDENGYWSISNLQGEVTLTPQYGHVLFNPIRREISAAESDINFVLLKEMGKGITSSAGEYVFSSNLTAAEEVELTVIVEDYETGEKLAGIEVEIVVDGATLELFFQDTKGEYLPEILMFDMDNLENYPGVEVREGSLVLLIKAALLAKPYLEWAIANPSEASAVAALGVAAGLDAYELISYTAGGIAIATGAGTLPGAGVIATGFASTVASKLLIVYAESVFANKKQVEHSVTIYIYDSQNSLQHKKIIVSAGATTDEIVEAIESEVGNREFRIEMPETNPAGAYYNDDGTPKFIYLCLTESESEHVIELEDRPESEVIVNVDVLHLRSGPSIEHDILDRLMLGTLLQVIGSENEWIEVITPDGKEGWVHGDYVINDEPSLLTPEPGLIENATYDAIVDFMERAPSNNEGFLPEFSDPNEISNDELISILIYNGITTSTWDDISGTHYSGKDVQQAARLIFGPNIKEINHKTVDRMISSAIWEESEQEYLIPGFWADSHTKNHVLKIDEEQDFYIVDVVHLLYMYEYERYEEKEILDEYGNLVTVVIEEADIFDEYGNLVTTLKSDEQIEESILMSLPVRRYILTKTGDGGFYITQSKRMPY